jgi:hypothetical protein
MTVQTEGAVPARQRAPARPKTEEQQLSRANQVKDGRAEAATEI